MVQIPFVDSASFIQEVTIDGIAYILEFNWNSRGRFWSMSIFDRDQLPLLLGKRMAVATDLLSQHPDRDDLPPGELYVIEPSGNMNELEKDDLLTRAYILYFEEGELK